MARRQQARRRRQWPRWMLAAGLVALGPALLAWHDVRRPVEPAAPPPALTRTLIEARTARATAPGPVTRRRPVATAKASTRSTAPAASGEAEVCGFGTVQLPPDDPYGVERIPTLVREAALDQVDAQMLASADEQVRAAALMIGAQARSGEAHSRIDRLAQLAGATRDPVVYAIALEACKGLAAAQGGACQLLNRAQWARLDPDNTLAWLELAAEAQAHDEPESEAEAMHRAALAPRSDAHAGLLPALVERSLGTQAPPLQRTLALSASWSAQAAWAPSRASQAYAYCTAESVADANRRQTCAELAEALAQRGSSLLDMGAGLAIGRNVGWPAERLQALQQEHDAISEAGRFRAVGLDLSCDAVERTQAWMRELAAHGEVQAARAALAQSGRSIGEWSARYRKEIALATATAEAAAHSAATH